MTKRQQRLYTLLQRNEQKAYVLIHGIARGMEQVWTSEDLRGILDIVASDLQPVLKSTESLEKQLHPARRKLRQIKPRKTQARKKG